MRARLHVSAVVPGEAAAADADPEREEPPPTEVPPGDLLDEPPPYPRPDETADRLRVDPDVEYSRERHRERHDAALEA